MTFPKNKARKIVIKEFLYYYVVSRGPVDQIKDSLSLRVQNDVTGKQFHYVACPKSDGQEFTPKCVQAVILGERDLEGWIINLSGSTKKEADAAKAASDAAKAALSKSSKKKKK